MRSNIPLSLFMEQFWLYSYYQNISYPQIMKILIQQIEVISLLRLNPNYLSFISADYSIWSSDYYQSVYTSDNISYTPLYFGRAIISFCVQTIAINIFLFALFKLLNCCIKKHSNDSCFKKVIHNMLTERTHWWALMVSLFESDFLVLCYECINQFSMPFYYALQNKINLVLGVVVFFILTVYGLIGYSLLHYLFGNKTKCLLIFS